MEKLEEKVAYWQGIFPGKPIIPISALESVHLDQIFSHLMEHLPVHPPFFDKEELTDKPEKFFASEIVREKIFLNYKKEIPYSFVYAIDISEKALETARKNAFDNQVEVNFVHQDILKSSNLQISKSSNLLFDIIVSNPPYVRNLEKQEIKRNVLDYEPHLALFVDDSDALLFYRKIAQLALKSLAPNGKLFFEINQYLGEETVELLGHLGFKNIELRKDFMGNERMICCGL
jgi:SAM-dependent methyltransferase